MTTTILLLFVLGYLCIALEGVTKVSKAGVALFMSVACWSVYMFGADTYVNLFHPQAFAQYMAESGGNGTVLKFVTDNIFPAHIADTCETILFLMGAMTIVEIADSNGGFNFVTRLLHTGNVKLLLWEIVGTTFILSALLDNMTTCIVMVMVLKRLLSDRKQRLLFAGIIILAANAGGAFSPIGDVTTIMLWIKGCVSTVGIIKGLFLPSIVSVAVPALCVLPLLKDKPGAVPPADNSDADPEGTVARVDPMFSRGARIAIFCIGVLGLMCVPVFRSVTGLPPFVGVMGVLAILWITTEILIYHNKRLLAHEHEIRVSSIIRKIDMSTILFFLGILLAVGAVQETGSLNALGHWLNATFKNVYIVDSIIGILSSVIDNVPLVASAMGMYDIAPATATGELANFCQDGTFWELLAYCAGTGGSILIIGSAAGVVVMGLENISFGWYLKRFSGLALLGYFAGILVYWLLNL